jgi:Tfp pilus assembly protein PilO
MLSHVKSMVAVGLALVVAVAAGLWFRDRAARAEELQAQRGQLERQLAAMQDYPRLAADLDARLKAIRQESLEMLSCLAKKDMEEAQLVEVLAKTASTSGVEIVSVARADGAADPAPAGNPDLRLVRVTYRISIKGNYVATVKFFQGMTAWKPAGRLESLEILRGQEDRQKEQATLVISVFSPAG